MGANMSRVSAEDFDSYRFVTENGLTLIEASDAEKLVREGTVWPTYNLLIIGDCDVPPEVDTADIFGAKCAVGEEVHADDKIRYWSAMLKLALRMQLRGEYFASDDVVNNESNFIWCHNEIYTTAITRDVGARPFDVACSAANQKNWNT